jgi:hypothetical protein
MADLTPATTSQGSIRKLGGAPFLEGFELSDLEFENGVSSRQARMAAQGWSEPSGSAGMEGRSGWKAAVRPEDSQR